MRFTKMHGLGNDFMVIDALSQSFNLSPEKIRELSDRRAGIGFDQLLMVEAPLSPNVDFRYRIYNADGSEVENCGNGARCFAQFVRQQRLTGKTSIVVETVNGNMTLRIQKDGAVAVDMGVPKLKPSDVPFLADEQQPLYQLELDDSGSQSETQVVTLSAVSVGNPHAVLKVDSVEAAPVEELGPKVQASRLFPEGVNVGFMSVLSRTEIGLRVYERGVGETRACGTGACAAVVAGILNGWLDPSVTVHLRGGDLTIEWQGEGQPVIKTGPATTVFDGKIKI